MLHHPDQMQKVQEELDNVVGRDRLPKFQDIPYLPITESTICEVLRIQSIIPLGTTHSNSRDVDLAGFQIPANTHVVPLINSVHMDPTLWNPDNVPELEPTHFNPSRFINNEGKVFKPEYFMPFGVGRRMCLGESLAKMELFLYFSALLHTFSIRLPEGDQMPSLKGISGVTIAPDRFGVCLVPRPLNIDVNDLTTPLRNFGSK
jgi:26-hydroxylase